MIKMGVRVNIDGIDAQFEEVLAAIEGNLDAVANVVLHEAQATTAFDDSDYTGNLRASIKKRKSKFTDGGFIVEASGRGKSKGYHAANVEFGHVMIAWGNPTGKRVPAHPFMRPAAEKGFRSAVELFRVKK
jgi:hypothetical protein